MHLDWAAPAAWRWLSLLIVVAAGLWIRRLYLRTDPPLTPRRRRFLLLLRLAVLVLLGVGIAGPRLVHREAATVAPAVVVVVDDSASMARADAPGGETRWRQALRVVAAVDSLVRRLSPRSPVLKLRGNGLVPPDSLRPRVPPERQGSDPAALMRRALLAGLGEAPPVVIGVTDGRATVPPVGGTPWPTPAPPLLVGVGAADGGRPPRIVDLRYPRRLRVGDRAVVELGLAAGDATGPLAVTLARGDSVLAERTVPVAPGRGLVHVALPLVPDRPGLALLRLTVRPAGEDSALADQELAVRVTRRRRRLLVVAPRPGWSARFLLQAAAGGELAAEAAWTTPHGWLRGDSLAAWEPPRRAAGWHRWEGVVLVGDGRALPAPALAALAEAVRGGTGLAVIAPSGRGDFAPAPVLRSLLPVTGLGRAERAEWRLQVPSNLDLPGPLAAAFWRRGTAPEALPGWLPPLDRLVPCRPRPGTLVLLEARRSGGGEAVPVVVRSGGAASPRLWCGSDGIWLDLFWRPPLAREEGAGDSSPFRRWLGALLDDLAAGSSRAAPLTLAGMRDLYRAGENIPLQVTVDTDSAGTGAIAVAVEAVPAAGDTTSRVTAALRGTGATWRGTLPPLPPGVHRLRPFLVTAGGDTLRGRPLRVAVTAGSPENDPGGQDADRLRDLAAGWGGIYLDAGRSGTVQHLASFLQEQLAGSRRVVRVRVSAPAGRPWYLLLVVVLLAGEWWWRRRWGLQ